jgi:hypothetical protein
LRVVTLAGVAAIVLLVVGVLWVDEGEVVVLTTVDDRGRDVETGLWIVDIGGRAYLRAGHPDSEWLAQLRARPEAELERHGVINKVRAVPVEGSEVIAAVNRAMREKYGLVDVAAVALIDHSGATAIWIESRGVPRRNPR